MVCSPPMRKCAPIRVSRRWRSWSCPRSTIHTIDFLINPGTPAEKEATEALLETVRYDISFRQLCVERGNIPEGCLPFLLGRPLSETLVMFGLALTRNNNRMGLVRRGEGRYGGPVFPDGKDLYR